MNDRICILCSLALATVVYAPSVCAQSMGQMEQMLNQVDNSTNWSQVPVAQPTVSRSAPAFGNAELSSPGWLKKMPQGTAPQPANPYKNLSRRDILRIFLDGSSGGGGSSNNSSALYGARENLQVARDQRTQADNACARTLYDSNSYEKKQAASEAQNHANAARAAADRATSAAQGGALDANDAAAQARNEADKAQEAANRANANANGGGW